MKTPEHHSPDTIVDPMMTIATAHFNGHSPVSNGIGDEQIKNISTACSNDALRSGHTTEWERLLVRLERRCLALAWRVLNDEHLAADAVQDGFLRAYRGRISLRQDGNAERWILAAVANASRDMARTQIRAGKVLEQMKMMPPAENAMTGGSENEFRLRRALAQLDEQARLTFLLVHQEGFSYQEVAHEFGWPVGTVRSKLHRARMRLREILR